MSDKRDETFFSGLAARTAKDTTMGRSGTGDADSEMEGIFGVGFFERE